MPRPTAAARGYGAAWQRVRTRFLRANPICILCGQPSQVADHYPKSRKQLLSEGITNPDAPEYLRPLCTSCHNKETAKHQPGGWARAGKRKRPTEKHPGLIG